MATSEVFVFDVGTNLLVNPVQRFSPQTVLLDTPDQIFADTTKQVGQIALPLLDATSGPLYNGKTILIVLQKILAAPPGVNQLQVILWDQYGFPIAGGDTLVANGDTVSVTAYWDQSTIPPSGGWIFNRLV
jgi:hypothetical protein